MPRGTSRVGTLPMGRLFVLPLLLMTAALAGIAGYVVPRGIGAHVLLVTDDPVRIADRKLADTFDTSARDPGNRIGARRQGRRPCQKLR